MKNNILVVAAHPDDEVLGMGGTIARHVAEGDTVSVLFLGDGVSSRDNSVSEEIEKRKKCAKNASTILGFEMLGFEGFPDNGFDLVSMLEIVKTIEKTKSIVAPNIVYTNHCGDLNIDHRIACQAVLTAFRPQPSEIFTEIRCFEVNSSTEWGGLAGLEAFHPNTYVDIGPYLKILLNAYSCYVDEVRADPHARSLESLKIAALRRGREIGVDAAEAFVTVRRIIR